QRARPRTPARRRDRYAGRALGRSHGNHRPRDRDAEARPGRSRAIAPRLGLGGGGGGPHRGGGGSRGLVGPRLRILARGGRAGGGPGGGAEGGVAGRGAAWVGESLGARAAGGVVVPLAVALLPTPPLPPPWARRRGAR